MLANRKILESIENTTTAVDEQFTLALHPIILGYLIKIIAENPYLYNQSTTFLKNIIAAGATYISHNLVWNISIDETLAFATQQPQSLLTEVEIKDPHGQRMRGTTLKMLKMVGDCNPRELKEDEKDFGLDKLIQPAFSSMPDEYNKQLEAWHRSQDSEEATNRITSATTVIETICQKICESKEITDNIQDLQFLDLPIVNELKNELRKAIEPDPDHVVTEGFNWDFRIFLRFFTIFEANVDNDNAPEKNRPSLGRWDSIKSNVFEGIVYPALQARIPRCDLPLFRKGLERIEEKDTSLRIDFSNGVPEDLHGHGREFFFGFSGDTYTDEDDLMLLCALRRPVFQNLYQAKTSFSMWNQAIATDSSNETVPDNMINNNIPC